MAQQLVTVPCDKCGKDKTVTLGEYNSKIRFIGRKFTKFYHKECWLRNNTFNGVLIK